MLVIRKSLPGAFLTASIAIVLSGCGDKENGMKQFVPPTAAQTQQYKQSQIDSIKNDPNIPEAQKAGIIAMYQKGPQSSAPPRTGAK